MKTLFVVPLLFTLPLTGAAKPCDSTESSTPAAAAAAPTPATPHTDNDAPAKKSSTAPASRPPAPKREPTTRPVHLFME